MGTIITGITLGLSLAAPLGPVNIEAIKRGFQVGFRGTFLVGMGAVFADIIFCVLVLVGLVPLMAAVPGLEVALWGLGALVLMFLGLSGIKEGLTGREIALTKEGTGGGRSHFAAGLLAALFNPYGVIWFMTVGGSMILGAVQGGGLGGGLVFIASFLGGVTIWICGLGLAINFARRLVSYNTMRFITVASSLVIMGFGFSFAYRFFMSFI